MHNKQLKSLITILMSGKVVINFSYQYKANLNNSTLDSHKDTIRVILGEIERYIIRQNKFFDHPNSEALNHFNLYATEIDSLAPEIKIGSQATITVSFTLDERIKKSVNDKETELLSRAKALAYNLTKDIITFCKHRYCHIDLRVINREVNVEEFKTQESFSNITLDS